MELVAAKRLSDGLRGPLDVETRKYRSRAVYACAFIVAQFRQQFAPKETELINNQEYSFARTLLFRTVDQQEDLVEMMVKLDKKLTDRLAPETHGLLSNATVS